MADKIPTIDSHIHLWSESALATFNWCKPGHPLASEHSFTKYLGATSGSSSLKGFILVEADRVFDLSKGEEGWAVPLQETAYFAQIALIAEDAAESGIGPRCVAIVPWCPVPSGPAQVEKYLAKCEEVAGEDGWDLVRGVRFLLQDKDHGTMLQKDFVDAVKLLGRRGLVFELGIDVHRRGKKQMDEVLELIGQAHEGVDDDDKTTFVINHLAKPDLTIYNTADPAFNNWRNAMYSLSKCDNTYLKLSGGFSEMPDSLMAQSPGEMFQALFPWFGVVLATFGAGRIMFGSDWPVCTVGFEAKTVSSGKEKPEEEGKKEEEKEEEKKKEKTDDEKGGDKDVKKANGEEEKVNSWEKWKAVVDKMCWMASFDESDMKNLYGGTAAKAYGI